MLEDWLKEPGTPMWWPPKVDELYIKDDDWYIKAVKAITGWVVFTVMYGIAIFVPIFVLAKLW